MVQLKKLEAAMFPEVYDAFLKNDDPHLTYEDWQKLYIYNWETEEKHYGYVLLDGTQIVGVLGMIFSQRQIDGRLEKFCNLHSWYVKEEYRKYSMMMMRPLTGMKDYTLTDFTPTQTVYQLNLRLGYQPLNARLLVMLPVVWHPQKHSHRNYEVTLDKAVISPRLAEYHRQILQDYQPYNAGHCLIYNREDYCYMVFSRVDRFNVPYCFIHYLSNPAVFGQNNRKTRHLLQQSTGTYFVVVNERLVSNVSFPYSFITSFTAKSTYRSPRLQPHHIDTLYADISLLNLTTFSSVKKGLQRLPSRIGRGLRNFFRKKSSPRLSSHERQPKK